MVINHLLSGMHVQVHVDYLLLFSYITMEIIIITW